MQQPSGNLLSVARKPETGRGRADVTVLPGIPVAAWASRLDRPAAEPSRSRRMAHIGGIAAIAALVL